MILQVPFTLEQQRKIASVLNTFVYNSFVQNGGSYSKPLIDVAVRCLNLLYERDSRHKFCPVSSGWHLQEMVEFQLLLLPGLMKQHLVIFQEIVLREFRFRALCLPHYLMLILLKRGT